MEKGIWQEIEEPNQEFTKLGVSESLDYEKYYLYSLITHSTAIEGSMLTEMDTQLLFDESLTANGKPLVHHLMNEDLKRACETTKDEENNLYFLDFMASQLKKSLASEIEKYDTARKKGFSFLF